LPAATRRTCVGDGGAKQRDRVLLRALGGVAADVPQRHVDVVDAVLGEPRGDLQALVEVEAVGVAEVLRGQAHAEQERRGAAARTARVTSRSRRARPTRSPPQPSLRRFMVRLRNCENR
jgi:hypothetical protein